MQKIKAVLFDFGGVVVNAGLLEWISKNVAPYESIKNTLRPFQDKIDRGDLPVSAYNNFFAKKTGKAPEVVEKEIFESYSLYENVISLIKKLKGQHIKTAIVSNFPDAWFTFLQKRFHINDLFDEIFISSRLHMIKPEEALFRYVLSRLDVKPEETVFIDDTKYITDAVSKFGIHSFLFTSPEQLKKDLNTLGVRV